MEEMKNKDQQIEELRSQLAETDDVVGGLEKVTQKLSNLFK